MLKHPLYQYGLCNINIPARVNLGEYIIEKLRLEQSQDAFINGETGEATGYSTILQQAMNFAVSLSLLGVKRGDIVGICSENRPDFWGAVVGIMCTGATTTTINPEYTEGELKHVLRISKPKIIVVSPTTYKVHGKFLTSQNLIVILLGDKKANNVVMFSDLAVSSNESGNVVVNNRLARNVTYEEFRVADVMGQIDVAFILYSSGTSGLPKGVMLTHLNVLSQCVPTSEAEVIVKQVVSITPWFHSMGMVTTLTCFAKGRTMIFLPKFDVHIFLAAIEKYKLLAVSLVPPIIVAISKVQKEYDLSSVQLVFSGAAPLHKDTETLVKAKFPYAIGVFQGYGMTEATMALTLSVTDESTIPIDKPGSVGKPARGVVIKVVDVETRKVLGPGQPGEICAKGVSMMKGYVGKDKSADFDDEGFFKTGDIGYYDEEGSFFIVDRLKELIKYKGFQVAPAEIEALLLQHEAVRDAGVIGVPDSSAGEVPLAFVALQPGKAVTEKEIQQFVADRLSKPKHLRGGVRFIEAIPKNPSGKILRKELRKMAKSKKSKL